MDVFWILLISVSLITTSHLCVGQDEGPEKKEGTTDGDEAVTEGSTGNLETCIDPEVLTYVDKCNDTYQAAIPKNGLCLAYCHYNVCISDLKLDCNPPSIGDMSSCYELCIEKGLMEKPEKKHKGLSKKVITIICVIVLVLIVLLLLFVLYKIYKKRQQRKRYKGVSTIYRPTTEA